MTNLPSILSNSNLTLPTTNLN